VDNLNRTVRNINAKRYGASGMVDNEKYWALKKCIDVAAVLAIIYPIVILLWGQFQTPESGPLDAKGTMIIAAMFLMLPAVCWLAWRQMSAPLGTHPILDRLMNDRRLRLIIVFGVIVLFILLSKLIDHMKG
jgi:hypothetical protein